MRRFLAPAILLAVPAVAAAAAPVAGRWVTEDGKAVVTLAPCGRELCGRITQLLAKPDGPAVDAHNPDERLRTRPLVGLAILSGFTDAGKDWRGRIYDPKTGRTYKSVVGRNGDGTLKVQGCIAFLCRTQTWRAER